MVKQMIKVLISTTIITLIIVIIFILQIQQYIFFHPWHDQKSYNVLSNDKNFKEISINNDGKTLHGWLYNQHKNEPLIIFFGGNAQNSSNTILTFLNNNTFQYFDNYNFLMIDYPGYGLSEGKPSDTTMFEASEKIYEYAKTLDIDKNNIIIMGYSIGTGVATYVSSKKDIKALILIAPYDEALSLYNSNVNIFHGPLKILAKYKFESYKYAKKVNAPALIITSKSDEIINYNFSLNLSKHFKNLDTTLILEDTYHNDYFSNKETLDTIKIYLYSQNYRNPSNNS